jgi:hypothetical protein
MSLKFDGKSNWKAFYAKFSRYAEVSEWTEGECRDQLCWCLDGKASEYYALLVERNQEMVYMDLLFHLPSRITPKGGSKYGLIIMLEPPYFINSLLYVFRSDIRGITPGRGRGQGVRNRD